MHCPACAKPFISIRYENVPVEQCLGCKGVWLDQNKIWPIISGHHDHFTVKEEVSAIQQKGKDVPKDHSLKCPKCRQPLQTFQYAVNSGVYLDRCPQKCGFWLDPGELNEVRIVMREFDLHFGETHGTIPPEHAGIKKCPHPSCHGKPLIPIEYDGETVDYCLVCAGMWCEHDELRKIILTEKGKRAASAVHPAPHPGHVSGEVELAGTLPCVNCRTPMEKINYSYNSGIILDSCRLHCGVWLDLNAMERAAEFAASAEHKKNEDLADLTAVLKKIKQETKVHREKAADSLEVSKSGYFNRWIRSLARKGFLD